MTRIRAIILPALLAWPALAAAQQAEAQPARPVHVQRLIDALGGQGGSDGVAIERLRRDVELGGSVRGDTCVVRVPWSSLSPADEQLRTERMQRALTELPAAQRRDVVDRLTTHTMQVWWVPLARHPAPGRQVRKALKLQHMPDDRREMIHLGNDEQFAWYAAIGVMQWAGLQSSLALTSGDDPMAMALARLDGTRRDTAVARLCYRAVAAHGRLRAVAAIDGHIFDGSPHRGELIRAMCVIGDQQVTDWLIELTSSPDRKVAAAAKWALLEEPRQGAAELYAAWLAEGAGQENVIRELQACMAVGASSAAASLPAVLDKPYSLEEYLAAFRFRRELAGQPIAEEILVAAEVIMSADDAPASREPAEDAPTMAVAETAARAVYVLTTTDDIEAAAAIGMELAVCKSDLASEAGLHILGELPERNGKQMVQDLATDCRDRRDARRLKRVAAALGLAQGGAGGSSQFRGFNLRNFSPSVYQPHASNMGNGGRACAPGVGGPRPIVGQVGPSEPGIR